ncbi:MAG: arginine deiminase family protein, partial [Candidatus Thermoplasmatota archaeon]
PKKALEQHKDYAKLLEKNGVEVEELSPLEAYPDSIFLQDTAFIGKNSNTAVICRFGVSERRGEENSIRKYLVEKGYNIKSIDPPGTIEGGDILVTDQKKIFVGISDRTNESGINQFSEHLPDVEVVKVPFSEVFHLLSGVNFIGNGTLAVCPDIVDTDHFEDFELVEIKKEEQDTRYQNKPINMLYLGEGKILLPEGYKNTGKILEYAGYTVIKLNISEFWKGDAGMTCPMLLFYKDI